jgi:hypothetical protein
MTRRFPRLCVLDGPDDIAAIAINGLDEKAYSMGRGSDANTVTSVNQPPPQVMAAYQNLLGQAQNVANTLLQQYTGPLVAGFTPT